MESKFLTSKIARPILVTSLVHRLSLSLPLDFAYANIMHEKIEGEGEPGTELHPPVAVVRQEFNC